MFEPLNQDYAPLFRQKHKPDTRTAVSFDTYRRLWQGWFRGNSGQSWGQYLMNGLKITDQQAPGLAFASTVEDANRIFNQHYRLEYTDSEGEQNQ